MSSVVETSLIFWPEGEIVRWKAWPRRLRCSLGDARNDRMNLSNRLAFATSVLLVNVLVDNNGLTREIFDLFPVSSDFRVARWFG